MKIMKKSYAMRANTASQKIAIYGLTLLLAFALSFAIPTHYFGATNDIVEAATTLSQTSISLPTGSSYQLSVQGTTSSATWKTSNSSIATVSSKGVVTAKKAGTVTISAKVGSKTYKCTVKVLKFKSNATSVTMTKGKSYQVKITGTTSKPTYSSSNTSIASVSSNGTITGKSKGSASITIKVGKETFKLPVLVETPVISKTSVSLYKGNTYALKVTGTNRAITWSTNNKAVATVSTKGVITAVGKGQAIITAKLNDVSYTCKVSVGIKTVINCPDNITLNFGETKTISITAGDSFSYSSDESNIINASITPTTFRPGDTLKMQITGNCVGNTYILFKTEGGWTKKVNVKVVGTSVPITSTSPTINNVKVNSTVAYKQPNKTNPNFYVMTSVTNNNEKALEDMTIYYTFYDKDGNLLGIYSDFYSSPKKGQTFTFKTLVNATYYPEIAKTAYIKTYYIEGEYTSENIDVPVTDITTTVSSTSLPDIQVTNLTANYFTSEYIGLYNAFFSYTLTNTAATSKLFYIFFDVYDEYGNLIAQDGYNYDKVALTAGQSETFTADAYDYYELYGALTNGKISRVEIRIVEDTEE